MTVVLEYEPPPMSAPTPPPPAKKDCDSVTVSGPVLSTTGGGTGAGGGGGGGGRRTRRGRCGRSMPSAKATVGADNAGTQTSAKAARIARTRMALSRIERGSFAHADADVKLLRHARAKFAQARCALIKSRWRYPSSPNRRSAWVPDQLARQLLSLVPALRLPRAVLQLRRARVALPASVCAAVELHLPY